jgi:YHS domain-containing protein
MAREDFNPSDQPTTTLVRDVVCGMEIEAETAAGEAEFMGKTWYFCSDACLRKFKEAPATYATGY